MNFFIVKKTTPPKQPKSKSVKRLKGSWMSVLAQMAAASREDGGVGLQRLLHKAKFDERPHLSLTKHAA